jgi:hypothetical protein
MLLVNEPLVIIPLEKRANAASVMAPSMMLIRERGFCEKYSVSGCGSRVIVVPKQGTEKQSKNKK